METLQGNIYMKQSTCLMRNFFFYVTVKEGNMLPFFLDTYLFDKNK